MKHIVQKAQGIVVILIMLSTSQIAGAATNLIGDHSVVSNPALLEDGDLSLEGDMAVAGGIDFGIISDSPIQFGALFSYFTTTKSVTLDASEADASFVWRDNASATTAEPKMTLDGANILSIFKSSGNTAGITLNPNSGAVTLAGLNSGIYNSNGSAVLKLTSNGGVVFPETVKFEEGVDFGSGGILNSSNVGFLRNVLSNFWYRDPSVAATPVSQIALSDNIGSFKIVSNNGFLYAAGSFSNGPALINGGRVSNANEGVFIGKFNSSGQISWLRSFSCSEASVRPIAKINCR